MTLEINNVPMTRESLWRGRPNGPPRCVIMHATAGSAPGDYNWLRSGGNILNPVSVHYYISPTGVITQFVADHDRAWHAGESEWVLDGVRRTGLNNWSIGIELSHLNRANIPHSEEQFDAAVALTRMLVQQYNIPQNQLIRHVDCSPGRKTDPIALDWPRFVREVYALPQVAQYTEASALMGPALGTGDQALRWLQPRARRNAREIVSLYETVGNSVGVDWFLALAQANHETGTWTSALSQPSNRDGVMLNNPAGIGVTGESSGNPRAGYVWDADRSQYRACVAFWTLELAVRAHLGRLIAYATKPEQRTPEQNLLAEEALRWRGLPGHLVGSAPTVGELGAKWAVSPLYGVRVAALAERMRLL